MTDTDGTYDPDEPGVSACTRCPALVESRSRVVNGAGDPDAPLALVGEGPGKHEDAEGTPFVGRSGDVLEAAFAAAGIVRSQVWIVNCVRCRPPGNRDPTDGELANCRGFLDRDLAIVDPDLVVALGKVPAEHLLGRDVRVTAEAGTIEAADVGDARRDVLICPHPAATLYDPGVGDDFEAAIATAADVVGLGDPDGRNGGGQTRLGDY